MGTGQPIVADFVLDQAAKQPKPAYAAGLLKYVQSAPADVQTLGAEHERASKATAALIKIGSPAEMQELAKIAAGPYNATIRAVGGGLLLVEGPAPEEAATSCWPAPTTSWPPTPPWPLAATATPRPCRSWPRSSRIRR